MFRHECRVECVGNNNGRNSPSPFTSERKKKRIGVTAVARHGHRGRERDEKKRLFFSEDVQGKLAKLFLLDSIEYLPVHARTGNATFPVFGRYRVTVQFGEYCWDFRN